MSQTSIAWMALQHLWELPQAVVQDRAQGRRVNAAVAAVVAGVVVVAVVVARVDREPAIADLGKLEFNAK